MTNLYTIISQMITIICEIIVHLLIIVLNNERCTVHVLNLLKRIGYVMHQQFNI